MMLVFGSHKTFQAPGAVEVYLSAPSIIWSNYLWWSIVYITHLSIWVHSHISGQQYVSGIAGNIAVFNQVLPSQWLQSRELVQMMLRRTSLAVMKMRDQGCQNH
jgi:hypothetical protein